MRRSASEPAENQLDVRGKSSCTPSALLARVRKSPKSGCEAKAARYGMVRFFHTRIAGMAIAKYRMMEWVGPPC